MEFHEYANLFPMMADQEALRSAGYRTKGKEAA